jgi:hypothetical protein
MNSNNQEFDYADVVDEEREVFNPDGVVEKMEKMEIQTRKSKLPRRPTRMVQIKSNKFLDYEMDDDARSKARRRQRKGIIDSRSLLRQQKMAAQLEGVKRSGRRAASPILTMAERIRRRKRADKMKERQLRARMKARQRAEQRGEIIQDTLLRTQISSPPRRRQRKSVLDQVRDFAAEEEMRQAIRREAEAQARIPFNGRF